MLNYQVFKSAEQPTQTAIKEFMSSENFLLFVALDQYLQEKYQIKPKFSYSNCTMNQNIWRGWNIKYQKSGRSFCTIYPQQDYFLALVPGTSFEVRNKEDVDEVMLAVELRKEALQAKK
ncbi:DUF3788 family protein [Enterococcus dispar]|uniref:Uncharacterized protein n=1 Tax=Enterococcus dispar ATCC 51266 TaxID=1139219 RepID=S1P264_9ENTE|nr:DUF3788 family protein [Enterococcus dispar]EOT40246.1 hypothetical protein OMK_02098 [Enterococcus dispar ATCC 51266]EOW86471.1 hypothetical protein I569_01806 [Enterococcus dispar ATCC 51266]MCU7357385.1 DUF3788 domain-containing protein [Enterococcus dispar]MDT2706031.1 DUF3788 family protein [Enterococcus dispar]OJG39568.1 hypothetical protein RV01_GL001515 [Enterococcus dispar]